MQIVLSKMAEKPSHDDVLKAFRLFNVEGKRTIGVDDLRHVAEQVSPCGPPDRPACQTPLPASRHGLCVMPSGGAALHRAARSSGRPRARRSARTSPTRSSAR